ncbi:MAG: DUF1700 domain-containing protein [Blautia sp.]|nr:DUF1700 domain-containing protein [Blautia sp.]
MTKTEFLKSLGGQLSGALAADQVAEHVRYYDEYITEQVREGASESDVLQQLGDPRLIAKTIVSANSIRNEFDTEAYAERDDASGDSDGLFQLDNITWYGKLIIALVGVIAVFLLFTVLRIILPFLFIIILVVFITSRFRR